MGECQGQEEEEVARAGMEAGRPAHAQGESPPLRDSEGRKEGWESQRETQAGFPEQS